MWNLKKKRYSFFVAVVCLIFQLQAHGPFSSIISPTVNLRVNGHEQLVLDSLSFLCSSSDFVVLLVEEFRLVRTYIFNSNNKIKITCL